MNIWTDANGWPIPPIVLLVCCIAEILYFRGWRVLSEEERGKRTVAQGSIYSQWDSWFWRGIYFVAALVVFLIAASAPIDNLAARLFWVHMVQHLLLLVVMAPLLVAGAPLLAMWCGLPQWGRERVRAVARLRFAHVFYHTGHWLRQPVVSCILLILGTWIWHWPPLYNLALTNDIIHDWCEHLTFQVVSILFWTQIIPSPPLRPRLGYLGRAGCILVTTIQNVVLAAVLGFAQVPLYAPYAHLWSITGGLHGMVGGLTPILDQQFGAGIMWTFGDLPFGIAFSILIHRWLASQPDDSPLPVVTPSRAES